VIVLDASVTIELLGRTPAGARVASRIAAVPYASSRPPALHAPHLLDLEVVQVTRRRCAAGLLSPVRAQEMLADLHALPIRRHEHLALLGRIWELRQNFTAYDASYIALAELLDATLLTSDAAMALRNVHHAYVELI